MPTADVQCLTTKEQRQRSHERFTSLLRPGDCIVVNRASKLQRYFDKSGDYGTHVAMTYRRDLGDLHTIEIGPDGVFSRSIDEFLDGYLDYCHLPNTMAQPCIDEVVRTARASLAFNTHNFSKTTAFALQVHQLGRRGLPVGLETLVNESAYRTATTIAKRIAPRSVTCSGLVYRWLMAACAECRPRLSYPARQRVGAGDPMPTFDAMRAIDPATLDERAVDVEVIGAYITPSDLCVADCFGPRHTFRPTDGHTRPIGSFERSGRGPCGHPSVATDHDGQETA